MTRAMHYALRAGTALTVLAAGSAAEAQVTSGPASQAAPQAPGAPPVAAGNQATVGTQEQGAPAANPQPQAPGGGQAPTAQGAAAPTNSGQLQEIVVTATRSATNLQKTPVAVTAITTDQLQARGVTNITEIDQFVPGLEISTTGSQISIRGIGIDLTTPQPAVGLYLDDVYFPVAAANALGLFDMGRVEVLRGPQGTLFGRNTIAGAIQYVSNQPTHTFGGYIDAIGGSYGRHDFQGALNLPITDTLAVRVAGNSQDRDGFIKDLYNNIDRGSQLHRQARIIAKWTPSSRLSISLEGQYSLAKANGTPMINPTVNPNAYFIGLAQLFGEIRPYTQAYASTGKYEFPGYNQPVFQRQRFIEGQATIVYSLTDQLDVKSITAYSSTLAQAATDFDQSPLNIAYLPASHNLTRLLTEEGQVIGHVLDDRLRFTAGVYYFDQQNPLTQVPGFQIGLRTLPSTGSTETDILSEAVYGQATFNLTPQLSITGGLRYSHERNSAYQLAAGSTRLNSSFNNTSPYAGLNYQVAPNAFLYAKYSEGFLAGGQSVNANLPNGHLPFGPETARTFEGCARLEFFDHTLRINPTVFYTNWRDIQFTLLVPYNNNVTSATENAGDARIYGAELEAQWEATSQLLFTLAASYNNSRYTKVPALTYNYYPMGFFGPARTAPDLTINSPLERAPKYKVSASARYTISVTERSRLVTSISGTYTSAQNSEVTISDAYRLPGYLIAQARLQYDFGGDRYSAAFFVTNLTNKYYYTGGINFGYYQIGPGELEPGRPREFGGELTFRF